MGHWLAAAVAATSCGPLAATDFVLTYAGTGSAHFYPSPPFTFSEAGAGTVSVGPMLAAITSAGQISGFSFTVDLTISNGSTPEGGGVLTYGLSDLLDFRDSISDGRFTGFSFQMLTKRGTGYYAIGESFGGSDNGGQSCGPISSGGALVLSPPVPEPATWASLLAGLCLTGALMRRRTARVPAAAGCPAG